MALVHLEPGTVFAGDFRVLRVLSQGGMGAVYLVEQESTGARRALKIMLAQLVSDARHRRRFEREARIGSLIESDHVVQVVAAGVDGATGTPWLAMELLRGEDLGALMARRGRLSRAEVLVIVTQLCHALGAAHRAGVVHRDLKPENVFLSCARRADPTSEVKVLDFGIARMMAEYITPGTTNVGSPLWMSPEQTSEGQWIGPPCDVWALGLLTFHLLTGIYFWNAANSGSSLAMLLREIVLDDLPSASARAAEHGVASTLPASFDRWFARCVNRDPAARFPDAAVAFDELRAVFDERGPLDLDFDEYTTIDRADALATLSSIPPATPQDWWEEDVEVSVVSADSALDGARSGKRPTTRREHPSPMLWLTPRIGSVRVETGGGVSSSSPKIPRDSRSILRAAAIVAGAAVLVGVTLEWQPRRGAETRAGDESSAPRRLDVRTVPIPAGTFALGPRVDGDGGVRTMLEAFDIGEAEVTVASYRTCEEAHACPAVERVSEITSVQCNAARDDRLEHPINCITWDEAAAFCQWVGGSLPTEAQWEYAAAGGSEGHANAFPWGAAPNPSLANGAGGGDMFAFTSPVKSFPEGRSAFGVYDVAGNVAEWTSDPFVNISMEGLSPAADSDRAIRGGSYESDPADLKTSMRSRARPATRSPTLGFRCVTPR